jgi:hypothetical protein
MGVDSCVDDVDNLLVPSDDGFSSSEEFPSRSSDPYVTGPNPYFGDTEGNYNSSPSTWQQYLKVSDRSTRYLDVRWSTSPEIP